MSLRGKNVSIIIVNISLRKLLKKKGGDRLGRETTLDRGDPTTAAPGGQQFQQYHQDDKCFFFLYKLFHSHGGHAF